MIEQFVNFFVGFVAGIGLIVFLVDLRKEEVADLERENVRLRHKLTLVENRNAARLKRKVKRASRQQLLEEQEQL